MPITGVQMNAFDLLGCNLVRDYFLANPPQIGLIKNYITIPRNLQFSDFTESDFAGYTRYTLTGWTSPLIIDGRAAMTANLVTWTNTGIVPGDQHGWFIVDTVDPTRILFAASYDILPVPAGGTFSIAPLYTIRDGYFFG